VGSLLQDCLRDQDLLARLGGDEFGILLNDCGLEQGKKIANRIHQSIQEYRFVWQDYVFSIGASIGVTQIQGDLPAVDALKQADSACYLAKNQGRNQVCYYAQLQQQIACEKPTQLITRITQALTHSQFGMFYQKIFSIGPDREVVLFASEILVRLPGEEGGWIRPDAFLHTAERYNLMTEIDAWVVKTFCQFYRQICQQTQSTQFALNLSGASLNSDRLTSFIRTQLEIHHIPPHNICFEVTETVAITNLSRARALLQELKELGCRIALDDFGSGMSSFHYLRSLPVDYLKIDGSLIRDVDTDRVAQEMVAAIVKIGHEMGLKTIAEWVESDAVTRILLNHQNDYVQGFLHHVPEALSLTSG
jgi:EAL domain-containing protein (putative c-di-GMP-specific phosphodiesterase class I)